MADNGWRKSSRSGDEANDCVEARWRKSSRSAGGADSDCVETRGKAVGFQIRDSKLGDDSPIFDLTAQDFTALLKAAQR